MMESSNQLISSPLNLIYMSVPPLNTMLNPRSIFKTQELPEHLKNPNS